MYIVQVNDVPSVYKIGYFPRKYKLKSDAILAAKSAIEAGASLARVECPNGVELDFRPEENSLDLLQKELQEEREYLKNDQEFYLECMNNKPFSERHTDQEIRDGLIIFYNVYKFCKGKRDDK